MAKREFTDRFLKAIKPAPAGKRIIHGDAQIPGFGVRVTDKTSHGSGSFVLVARFPGSANPTARHIGDYPSMPLAQAREIARGWREDLRRGVDPKAKVERQRQEEALRRAKTFKAAFDVYAGERLSQIRTGPVVKAIVVKHVYPTLGDRPLREITRAEAKALILSAAKEMPVNANRILAYLKTFGSWAVDEDLLEHSPFASIKRPTSEKDRARDRVLSDTELRAVWAACGEMDVFGKAFKAMMLTGQRRTEVGAMNWSELDLREKLWTLPKSRTKAKRTHVLPLSAAAVEIIESMLPRRGDYVFSIRGGRPLAGWTKSKEALDRLAAEKARAIADETGDENAAVIPDWHLHDLRRTCATRLGKLGVSRVVIAKVLNHAIPGVTSVYDHHDYEPEKRAALDRWASYLLGIVNGAGDNVVSLTAARA